VEATATKIRKWQHICISQLKSVVFEPQRAAPQAMRYDGEFAETGT
jgi:hypothetical protein